MVHPVRVAAFEHLTERGRTDRLRSLALRALERFDLDVAGCRWLATSYNTLFRVDAADGERFVLRVGPADRIHAGGSEEVEAGWLSALRQRARIPAPLIVAASDGASVVDVVGDGVPSSRACTLITWVEGRPLRDAITLDGVREMGRLAGRIHDQASRTGLADAPSVLVADRLLYWRNEPRLDQLGQRYASVVPEARARAQAAIDALWALPPHTPHLLHGDVGPSNVMVSSSRISVIDFQDLFWGFEIQDLAVTVADLLRYEGGEALASAFRHGYEDERPWPDAEEPTFEALVMARWLHVLNLGLNVRRPGLAGFVDDLVARIATVLERAAFRIDDAAPWPKEL